MKSNREIALSIQNAFLDNNLSSLQDLVSLALQLNQVKMNELLEVIAEFLRCFIYSKFYFGKDSKYLSILVILIEELSKKKEVA